MVRDRNWEPSTRAERTPIRYETRVAKGVATFRSGPWVRFNRRGLCGDCGWHPHLGGGIHEGIREAAAAMSGTGARFEPDERRAALYERLYTGVYKEIYPALRPLFPALADALKVNEA